MEPDNKSNEVFENPEPEGIHSRGASFKSITSYASFRSCKTYKSMGGQSGVSRSSFKSCVSKLTRDASSGLDNPVFKDCHDDDLTSMYSVAEEDYHSFAMTYQNDKQIEKPRDPGVVLVSGVPSGESNNNARTRNSSNLKPEENGCVQYLGYFYIILAGALYAVSHTLSKFLISVNSWSLLFVRCSVQVIITLPFMVSNKSNPVGPKGARIRIILQGIVSGVLLLGTLLAIQRLPLGDAAAIFYSAPVFAIVLSSLVLQEHFGAIRLVCGAVLMTAIILITRPAGIFHPENISDIYLHKSNFTGASRSVGGLEYYPSKDFVSQLNVLGWPFIFNQSSLGAEFGMFVRSSNMFPAITSEQGPADDVRKDDISHPSIDIIGIFAALAVPVLSAYLLILTRQCKHVHYSVFVFWYGVGGSIVSVIGSFVLCNNSLGQSDLSQTFQVAVLIVVAFIGSLATLLMTKALHWVPPGKALILRSSEILVNYAFHIGLFNMEIILFDIVGVSLILVVLLFILLEDILVKRINIRFL